MPARKPDAEIIVPTPGVVTIGDVPCHIKPMKTREFLAFLKIITSGAGSIIANLKWSGSPEEVTSTLLAVVVIAIPNAVDEFIDFLAAALDPQVDGVTPRSVLGTNPDLDVLLDVFESVALQEKDNLSTLLGKAQAMLSRLATAYSAAPTPG